MLKSIRIAGNSFLKAKCIRRNDVQTIQLWNYSMLEHFILCMNYSTEIFNQTLQNMLSKATDDLESEKDWETVLQPCVFAYNTAVHSTTKYTPYFLMFGV